MGKGRSAFSRADCPEVAGDQAKKLVKFCHLELHFLRTFPLEPFTMKRHLLIAVCLLLTGCQANKIGPKNLSTDSMAYNHAVSDSIDSQVLLNIVRLRYRDIPTFLQVGIISSSYENFYSAGSDFRLDALNRRSVFSMTPRFSVERNEKPTTTFQPLRGEGFVREMLSPISIQTLALLHNSGWRVDRILRCCVQRVNSLENAPSASGPTPDYAPQVTHFRELVSLFRELQMNSAMDLLKAKDPETGKVDYYLTFDKNRADPNTLARIWDLLDVEPGLERLRILASHGKPHRKDEILIDTRAPISVMYFLSQGVDVPAWHEEWGKVTVTVDAQGNRFDWDEVVGGVIKVHSGPICGQEPAVIVNYRGTDFYIDDSDLSSKSTFSMLSQLLALQTGAPEITPVILAIP